VIKDILNRILDFALPPVCINCEAPLDADSKYLCSNCFSGLIPLDLQIDIIKERFGNTPHADEALSIFLFREDTPIQSLIHGLKYGQMKSIGRTYGKILGEVIADNYDTKYDLIIPVPLHKTKRRERGYNQSDYICTGMNEALHLDVVSDCLKRTRYTRTQTKLTREERKENVSNAFELNKKYSDKIHGRNIILVDDVITTGATILECARILKENNCGKILTCSIALAE
jgi:competence protein ComFC